LLVYPLAKDAHQTKDYIEMQGKKADDVLGSVEEFAKPDYGVDVFKLESPVNAADADGSAAVQAVFDDMGRLAGRPWVMLSAGAGKPEFKAVLEHAFAAGASGFLAGRAIWLDAFNHYPDWDAIKRDLRAGASSYMQEISDLADQKAAAWQSHACYGAGGARFLPDDASFRHQYSGF